MGQQLKGQHLTQHLGAYLPQPFSLAFCFTRVFNLLVCVCFLQFTLYLSLELKYTSKMYMQVYTLRKL